ELGQLAQIIDVTGDKIIFGDDAYRMPRLSQYVQAATGYFQFTFHRLIRVGYAAENNGLRLPLVGSKLCAELFRRIIFYHDPRLKIKSGRKAQVFVRGTCVAVNTAVLTS